MRTGLKGAGALGTLLVNRGEDPQLDAAIATALAQLKNFKPVELKSAPPYPATLGK